ncbi:hypothetical protein Tsubulata_019818 [Turnera subulata]|uniref:Wall-associated receptor kinase galacturonan-binding domain-containing protein n=1 Tax=Turnera subulata TaxID=218843 RepID=A0A9Q0JNP4_9ROSI|nr:hypothetical protein Tsubulata_019818 [Turnera subulata]
MVELPTRRRAVSCNLQEEERCLANYFFSCLKQDRLVEILDSKIVNEGNVKQLQEVAMLAKRCLRLKGDERPTMKEVAMELEGIRVMGNHPWVDPEENTEESQHLLTKQFRELVRTVKVIVKNHVILSVIHDAG